MTPECAEVVDGQVRLTLRSADGSMREVMTEHIITGTGYKVDLERLQFLSADIRRDIAVVQSAPVLSANFESSVSGLYFVGLSAANTFGPVMRFAFGAGFAARRVSGALMRTASRNTVPVAAAETVVPARTERTTTR